MRKFDTCQTGAQDIEDSIAITFLSRGLYASSPRSHCNTLPVSTCFESLQPSCYDVLCISQHSSLDDKSWVFSQSVQNICQIFVPSKKPYEEQFEVIDSSM